MLWLKIKRRVTGGRSSEKKGFVGGFHCFRCVFGGIFRFLGGLCLVFVLVVAVVVVVVAAFEEASVNQHWEILLGDRTCALAPLNLQ